MSGRVGLDAGAEALRRWPDTLTPDEFLSVRRVVARQAFLEGAQWESERRGGFNVEEAQKALKLSERWLRNYPRFTSGREVRLAAALRAALEAARDAS